MLRIVLVASALLLLTAAPAVSACAVEPPTTCSALAEGIEVCHTPACPPNPGRLTLRALGLEVGIPYPK